MSRRKTQEDFVSDATKTHSGFYSYGRSVYTGSDNKVTITCPHHGEFDQVAYNHLRGSGCSLCKSDNAKRLFTKPLENFIQDSLDTHSSTYEYHLVKYVNSHTPIKIVCKIHGVFSQKPYQHLEGKGCNACSHTLASTRLTKTTESFNEEVELKFPSQYDLTKVNYINGRSPITLTCNSCKTSFTQTPFGLLQGYSGCSCVSRTGFNYNSPAILYYLKIKGQDVYKIGVTNRTVEDRYSKSEHDSFTIVKTWKYLLGREAYNQEQAIINLFSANKYKGSPLLRSGNTELLTGNPLCIT